MKRMIACVCAAAALTVGTASAAPIDGTFNYQGRLTNSGSVVTGTADLTFSLWDAAAAGGQIGSDIVLLNVPVEGGLFNVDLDFGVSAFAGEMRWIEIEARSPAGVGGYTLLTPRQQILGAPYAIQTRGIYVEPDLDVDIGTSGSNIFLRLFNGSRSIATFGSSTSDDGGLLTMRSSGTPTLSTIVLDADADDTDDFISQGEIIVRSFNGDDGGILEAQNDGGNPTVVIRGGSFAQAGSLTMFNPSGSPILALDEVLNSGRLRLFDPSGGGNDFFSAFHDSSLGGGGVLTVDRNDTGTTGFGVEGNIGGTESTLVSINGTVSGFRFDTSLDGSISTQLPNNAIHDTEILDEPGVVAATNGLGSVTLTGAVDTLLSRTINAPTSGFCVVIGTCEASMAHTSGTSSSANFGVSDSATTFPGNQDVEVFQSAILPSAQHDQPVTVHGTFSVSAGSNTFYLLGDENSGAFTVFDSQLTVMFFPTAYGVITPTVLTRSGADNDATAPKMLPMSAADIKAEQMQSTAFDQARRDAEFAEMRAMMQALQSEVDDLKNQRERAPYLTPPVRRLDDETGAALGHNNTGSR